MIGLGWKSMRKVTCYAALAIMALGIGGQAVAEGEGEGAVFTPFCSRTLSGDGLNPPVATAATGTVDLSIDLDNFQFRLDVTFSGITGLQNVAIFADDGETVSELINLGDGTVTSPATFILDQTQSAAVQAAEESGSVLILGLIGDPDAIGGTLRCPQYEPFCSLPMSGSRLNPPVETEATGNVEISIDPETNESSVEVTFTGVTNLAGVGVFRDDGVSLTEVINFADGTAVSPLTVELTAAQVLALNEIIQVDGDRVLIVALGASDSIAADFSECAPAVEGEGAIDGEGTVEGEGAIEGEGEPATGNVRVIHGAASFGSVQVCNDGSLINDGTALPYGTIADYLPLPVGFYNLSFFAEGDACGGTALGTAEFFLGEGTFFTIALADSLAKGAPVLQVFVNQDDNTASSGVATVRAYNLSPDSQALDINKSGDALGATPIFDNVPYGGPTAAVQLTPQNFTPSIRNQQNDAILATGNSIALGDGGVYTIYLLGLQSGEPALVAASSSEIEGLPVEGEEEGEGTIEGEGEGVVEGEGEGTVEGEGEGTVEGEGEGTTEGEGEGSANEPIDFCAVQDEIAGIIDDPILGPVLADLLGEDISILSLLGCDVADLNGPLPVLEPEGEEIGIADQLPDPNGILDGPFELAVLAELINNGDAYTDLLANGGIDSTLVAPAFEANLATALGSLAGVPPAQLVPLFELLLGDALPVCGAPEGEVEGECFTEEEKDAIILEAANLVPNIGLLLAGYITLGDDNSVAVAILVLTFIDEAVDGVLGLGLDPQAYTRLDGILSISGDLDGDGCTQESEFTALGETPDSAAYVAAVLDPNTADCPTPIDFCAVQDDIAGIIDDPILGPVLADLLGEDISILSLLACDVADLNGPLPVLEPEGEEVGIADQLPDPNGILDGPFELAVLAELINNGGAYTDLLANGGVDSTLVASAFEANLATALGSLAGVPPAQLVPLFELLLGDALPICGAPEGEIEGECFTEEVKDAIILRAAELVPNIGLLLAGYITLGDDNSVAVALLVLTFIDEAVDGVLGLGLDPEAYTRLDGILSADADADGDGCTQRQEFNALFPIKGLSNTELYVSAVLDPDNTPTNCDVTEGEEPVIHNADTDGDGLIGLSELLRIIQFYNAGLYTCDETNQEDGFTPGDSGTPVGTGLCVAHDIDFGGGDGIVSLSELLRAIQFFNLQVELLFTGIGEDGWDF